MLEASKPCILISVMKRFAKGVQLTLGVIILGVLVTAFIRMYVIETKTASDFVSAETKTLRTADGTEVAYHVFEGSNDDTIVLVGGLGAWRESWRRTVEIERERGNGATFIVIDLPPFGLSQVGARASYSRIDQAERIQAVIEAETTRLGRVTVLGHSYGGGPVAELLLRSPQVVDAAILVSPVVNLGATASGAVPAILSWRPLRTTLTAVGLSLPMVQRGRLESFLAITDEATYETLRVFTQPFTQADSSGRLGDWLVAYLGDDLPTALSTQPAWWASTTVPVTLVWGDKDTLTPISDAYELVAVNPAITVIPLSGVGHIPMLEDTDSFHDALKTVW